MYSNRAKQIFKKYYIGIIRSKGSVYSISMGIAIGLFMSMAIPIGQMLVAIPLAFLFRAHRGMAILFTFVSNPYTTAILYSAACLIGAKILGIHLTYVQIQSSIHEIYSTFTFHEISILGWDLFISFMIGGPIIGLIMAIFGYFISAWLLILYRKKKN